MSQRRQTVLDHLEEQIISAKRVALFGHRAVGKSTLLAMFYREASHGRVPGLRLAAADPATADYLGDRIAQLESGEPLAGTLADVPLRLRLYRDQSRIDLVLYDYQGEDVELGSHAPIHEFFAECDAILLCLDGEATTRAADRRRRQLEIEQLIEGWVESTPEARCERPLALVVTKYDRVLARNGPPPDEVDELVEDRFGMTTHAMKRHLPRTRSFAVSAFGVDAESDGKPPLSLRPLGLDKPLQWLAAQLEELDLERWHWMADLAPGEIRRLRRCFNILERRYHGSPQIAAARQRLARLSRQSFGKTLLKTAFVAGLGMASLAGYDAYGYHAARQFERSGAAPAALERSWSSLLRWHPTLSWFWPAQARSAQRQLAQWQLAAAETRLVATGRPDPRVDQIIQTIQEEQPELANNLKRVSDARQQAQHDAQWRALRVGDLAAITDLDAHLAQTRQFLRDFPDSPHITDAVQLVHGLEAKIAARQSRAERDQVDALIRAVNLPHAELQDLLDRARQFLDQHPESQYTGEVAELVEDLARRIDEADIEKARSFLREQPTNFLVQRQKYQAYLKTHSTGGRFVTEALAAIDQIDSKREIHLYRQAFEHAKAHPDDVSAVAERLRVYVDSYPSGKFASPAHAYLSWWESISSPREYSVTLRRAEVDPNITKPLAGSGPNLSVELWVAGVKYGPSPIVPDSHQPIWNYTFPTPIRWRYGDPVIIRILDNDWGASYLQTFHNQPDDKLALRLLTGTVRSARGGPNSVIFTSDFQIPVLPAPE
jgi:GTPase SAR1 family protein